MPWAASLIGWLTVAPQIVVYTMGPGEHVFERFGHAAICVERAGAPGGTCYNYGTTDFQTPAGEIGWDVIRGQSVFWVSTAPKERMLAAYIRADRDVYRQVLKLPPEQARALATALAASATEERRYYVYHHFDDNCSTRVRDAIEAQVGAPLSAPQGEAQPTRRQLVMRALGDLPEAAVAVQLLGGRRLDEPLTPREALFLPDQLREAIAVQLGVTPERVHQRRGPPFRAEPPTTWPVFAALAVLVTAPLLLARRAWARVVALGLASLVLGGVGALVLLMAVFARVPELQLTEALLVFWPTDLAWWWLARRGERGVKQAAMYSRLRVMSLVAVLGLSLAGLLLQPLTWLVIVALLPHAWLGFGAPTLRKFQAARGS
ncbi:MAG: DUF4105 domain-containing protein [Polyangiaceae bacterium]|nr:DUF4105 domain-containing protein [Polyangiaceae bacterium]